MLNIRQKITESEAYRKINKNFNKSGSLRNFSMTDTNTGKTFRGFQARKALAGLVSQNPFKKEKLNVLKEKWGLKDRRANEVLEAINERQMSETEVKSTMNKAIKGLGEVSETKFKEMEKEIRQGKSWFDVKKRMQKRLIGERKRNVLISRYSSEKMASRTEGSEALKEALTRRTGDDSVKIDHTRIAKGQSYGVAALSGDGSFSQDDFSSESRSSIGAGKPAQGVASGVGAKKIEASGMSGTTPKGSRPIGF